MNRRDAIRTAVAGAALLTTPGDALARSFLDGNISAQQSKSLGMKTTATDSFHLGMAGYTFVRFDLDRTLQTLRQLNVGHLCIKDFHLPLDSTADEIAAFKKKLAAAGVTGYAVGPIYMKTEAEVDRAFDYAERVGVKMLVGVPNYELLDYTEQKVREKDIRLAIHLHGPDMPLYPHATDIWENVCRRDARMGMCLDIGHNLRMGQDPIRDLKRYHRRVFDIHLKDVTGPTKQDGAIELGRGRIDFPRFVSTLRKVGYTGSCSLEYEKDMDNPFLGIAESVGYFRAICDATR